MTKRIMNELDSEEQLLERRDEEESVALSNRRLPCAGAWLEWPKKVLKVDTELG